ncbi:hypothetical protein CD30_16890 [Ureibacillus massiliensis 4400831 = CIP 108448 = CCUG 49529]|uniref:Uncharacterized protein n=1 Tax=Ureibacillus massiliensis 4400831 = CIP 108448 = CCUG 49529 TaxID=1211035 RepID=A0A0A3J2P8_9BACL|nr:hypothetical protein [Ureibacillus massiliensis]KGR89468.1 hypothetical protein CD30_16890 [Ureibacillus massiliensis 4400831 = CIP 108448 = CCUG 49529]
MNKRINVWIGTLILVVVGFFVVSYFYKEYKIKSPLDSEFMSDILIADIEPEKAIDGIDHIVIYSFENHKTYSLKDEEIKIILKELKGIKIKRKNIFFETIDNHYAVSFGGTTKIKSFNIFISNENSVKFDFERNVFNIVEGSFLNSLTNIIEKTAKKGE